MSASEKALLSRRATAMVPTAPERPSMGTPIQVRYPLICARRRTSAAPTSWALSRWMTRCSLAVWTDGRSLSSRAGYTSATAFCHAGGKFCVARRCTCVPSETNTAEK